MAAEITASLWGLGGAFCWAGPQLGFCLRVHTCKSWKSCFWEFLIALFAGALFAPSFGAVLGFRFPWLVQPSPYALWTAIGLAAYPSSPLLLRLIKGRMSGMLKGPTE